MTEDYFVDLHVLEPNQQTHPEVDDLHFQNEKKWVFFRREEQIISYDRR